MNKVLFVILGLDFSGAETVLLQYLNENSTIDPYFAFVYQGKAIAEFEKKFERHRIFALDVPYKKNELRIAPRFSQYRLANKLLPLIAQLKVDVVYFNNTHEVILSRVVKRKCGIPCIGHVHDMQDSIGTLPKKYEAKRAFRELDQVITVSQACKSSWNSDKMQVVYNGVPDSYFKTFPTVSRSRDKKLVIGYVGMLSARKGFDILAKAIEELDINADWKIAYNKIEKRNEDTLGELREKFNVEIFCNIGAEEVKQLYDEMDILLIPSRQDPLPTVAIEAMARRVLVLGADTGGIPELVGSDKFLFRSDSLTALKQCLRKYCALDIKKLKLLADEQYNRAYKLFRNSEKKSIINQMIYNSTIRKRG